MQFCVAFKGNVGDDVYYTFAGLSSEERAGNGPGLTRVHATVSTTYEEGRAGVGPGLMAIHAPISQPSFISMEDVTASELPTTELLAKNEELQRNSDDSKHIYSSILSTFLVWFSRILMIFHWLVWHTT